jgi:hypothetical protein
MKTVFGKLRHCCYRRDSRRTAGGVRRKLFAMPCKRDRLPNHGGLTPAALVNVRFCTANVAIFQRTGVVHQERLA